MVRARALIDSILGPCPVERCDAHLGAAANTGAERSSDGVVRWSPPELRPPRIDSKDYRLDGVESFGRRQVSTYTTVDLVSQYRITPDDQLSLGIQNLFNRDYYPLYSQLLRNWGRLLPWNMSRRWLPRR